jgi:hypothetical protein
MANWNFKGNKGKQKTTITNSTAETPIISAYTQQNGDPISCDLYGLIIANTSASSCNVIIKSANAGSTEIVLSVPAGETRGFTVPQADALEQPVGNNVWTATCSASISSIEITALFTKNS